MYCSLTHSLQDFIVSQVFYELIATVAASAKREPDDLLEPYGEGDGIAIINEDRKEILGFICAERIPTLQPCDSAALEPYRVITLVWASPSLDSHVAEDLRKALMQRLLHRLRAKTVIVHHTLTAHVPHCKLVKIRDLGAHIKYRVANLLRVRLLDGECDGLHAGLIPASESPLLRRGSVRICMNGRARVLPVHNT